MLALMFARGQLLSYVMLLSLRILSDRAQCHARMLRMTSVLCDLTRRGSNRNDGAPDVNNS